MANSTIILSNQTQMSYTGEKHRGDGFYGFADGLHTVSFHVTNFTGRICLQATLLENPTEADFNGMMGILKPMLKALVNT